MSVSASIRLSTAASFQFLSKSCLSGDSINGDVKGITDDSGPVAITHSTIVLKNVGDTGADEFIIAMHPLDAVNVHDVWVNYGPEAMPVGFPVSADLVGDIAQPGATYFRVNLPTLLKPSTHISVEVHIDLMGAVEAVRTEISGHDRQYIRSRRCAYKYAP